MPGGFGCFVIRADFGSPLPPERWIMHPDDSSCFDVVFCQSPGYHNSPLGYPWPVVPTGKLRAVSMALGAAPSSKLKTGGLISSEYSLPVSEHHTGA